jgi:hypothetical protein
MCITVCDSAAATAGLITELFEHLLYMRHIGLAQFDRLLIVFHVIITVRQSESSLVRFRNHLARISVVLR